MTRMEHGLVFIVGVGRSGTSLLQSMLHAHPKVCFVPEFNFIRRFLATDELQKSWAHYRDSVATRLVSDELIARLGLGEERIRDILNTLGKQFSASDLYLQLLKNAAVASKGHVMWIGDKDPRSVEYLPVLHHFFPEARVLHIIRDPRDVLSSKKKAGWSKDHSPLRHIFANRVQLKMGRRQGPQLFGPAYLEFAYEELIGDPAAVLDRICRLLGIEFNTSMLDFPKNSRTS